MPTVAQIRYEELRPGDHIQVTRRVKVGLKIWEYKVAGTVVRTERRRNGLHVDRNQDDKAFQDLIVLRKDGTVPEETTVTLDEFTVLERA
ncbi:MAG: hypothetical protein U0903_02835 [Planctomycetales bacterium]